MGKLVGAYIQALRQQQGLSLRELGRELRRSPATLSLMERGEREVSISVLYRLTERLQGNFTTALHLLALDAGIPPGALRSRRGKPRLHPDE